MPKIGLKFTSQRKKPVDGPVDTYILKSKHGGIIRDDRNLKITSKRFNVDAAPDLYTLGIEINGFRSAAFNFTVTAQTKGDIFFELQHKCKDLPEFSELSPTQQTLLQTFAPNTPPHQIWESLSDNQCATFFQITHALTRRKLNNNRVLADYINKIRVIGGSEIIDTLPDEKEKSAVGWRMHAVINKDDRKTIEKDLRGGDIFGEKDPFTDPTHAKFGLIKSYRETGDDPKIQIVLDKDNIHVDLDLDVTIFHRSSPQEVFDSFIERFPEVSGIYKY